MPRAAMLLLLGHLLACGACTTEVETIPHGVILCETTEECDDDNDCTTDTCEAGRCKFVYVEDGTSCTDPDGAAGECSAGVCQ